MQALLSVNRELVILYWQIGKDILQRQQEAGQPHENFGIVDWQGI